MADEKMTIRRRDEIASRILNYKHFQGGQQQSSYETLKLKTSEGIVNSELDPEKIKHTAEKTGIPEEEVEVFYREMYREIIDEDIQRL